MARLTRSVLIAWRWVLPDGFVYEQRASHLLDSSAQRSASIVANQPALRAKRRFLGSIVFALLAKLASATMIHPLSHYLGIQLVEHKPSSFSV